MNRFLAVLSAWLVTAPIVAWAQETLPERAMEGAVDEAVHEEVVQHEGAHSSGLPQFNPETWPSQIFWLAVSFIILYVFFSRFILPSLTSTIEGRAAKIQGDIGAAEELSSRADAIRSGYESELRKAAAQNSSDMKAIDEDAKARLAASLAALKSRYDAEVAEVDARLTGSKQTVIADMQKLAAELAAQAAEKIAGVRTDISQADDAVQSVKNRAEIR